MKTGSIDFHFKGCFHVYPTEWKQRNIEEFCFEVFDDRMPSEMVNTCSAMEELKNGGFDNCLLDLEEIETNKNEEFYFEIKGKAAIEYYTNETIDGTEYDAEYVIHECKIDFIKRKLAHVLIKVNTDD